MARLKTKRLEVLPPLKMLELPLGRTIGFCVKIDLVREKVAQMRPKLEKFFSSFSTFCDWSPGICAAKNCRKNWFVANWLFLVRWFQLWDTFFHPIGDKCGHFLTSRIGPTECESLSKVWLRGSLDHLKLKNLVRMSPNLGRQILPLYDGEL